MNKLLIIFISAIFAITCKVSIAAQHGEHLDDTLSDEDTIGGIGGTGIRSMNRPEILERPDYLERPEILESREALDESLDLDNALDDGDVEMERPEVKEEG